MLLQPSNTLNDATKKAKDQNPEAETIRGSGTSEDETTTGAQLEQPLDLSAVGPGETRSLQEESEESALRNRARRSSSSSDEEFADAEGSPEWIDTYEKDKIKGILNSNYNYDEQLLDTQQHTETGDKPHDFSNLGTNPGQGPLPPQDTPHNGTSIPLAQEKSKMKNSAESKMSDQSLNAEQHTEPGDSGSLGTSAELSTLPPEDTTKKEASIPLAQKKSKMENSAESIEDFLPESISRISKLRRATAIGAIAAFIMLAASIGFAASIAIGCNTWIMKSHILLENTLIFTIVVPIFLGAITIALIASAMLMMRLDKHITLELSTNSDSIFTTSDDPDSNHIRIIANAIKKLRAHSSDPTEISNAISNCKTRLNEVIRNQITEACTIHGEGDYEHLLTASHSITVTSILAKINGKKLVIDLSVCGPYKTRKDAISALARLCIKECIDDADKDQLGSDSGKAAVTHGSVLGTHTKVRVEGEVAKILLANIKDLMLEPTIQEQANRPSSSCIMQSCECLGWSHGITQWDHAPSAGHTC